MVIVTASLVAYVIVLKRSPFLHQCEQAEGIQGTAAGGLKDGDVLPPCDEDCLWYRNKCYYFSVTQGNWTEAKDSCAAMNSSLATIDSQKELDFLVRYIRDLDHWIGLWRDSDKQWKWTNGTGFNNWFLVADYSDYAYLDHRNVKSGESYNTRHWICNKVSIHERKPKD